MRRRRIALYALAGLLFLACAYSLYWILMAREMAASLKGEQPLGPGIELSLTPSAIRGFPFAFRAEVSDLLLILHRPDGLVSLAMPAGAVEVSAFDPYNFLVSAKDKFGVDMVFSGDGRSLRTIDAMGGSLRIAFHGEDRLAQLQGNFYGLTFHLGPERDLNCNRLLFSLALPPSAPTDYRSLFAEFSLSAHILDMPNYRLGFVTGPIENFAFTARLMGGIAEDRPLSAALAAWRDGGGTLEIDNFRFTQPPLALEGAGTFALDRDLQPSGAMNFKAYGLKEAVEALRAEGAISARDATASLVAIGAMTRKDKDGKPRAEGGLSLQDGMAWLGPLPLAPLPRFEWSQP